MTNMFIPLPTQPHMTIKYFFFMCLSICLCNLPCQTTGQIILYVIYSLMIIGQKTKIYHKFSVQRVQLHVVKGNVSLKDNIMNNNILKKLNAN